MQNQRAIYEFGEFRLDVGEKRLRRTGGEVLTISPKAFDLLVFLVENAGQLLEKNALMDNVWADSFVEEGNLKIHIHTLRKVFSESGFEFIETVPRRGYRFNADVRDVSDGEILVERITKGRIVIEQTQNVLTASRPARKMVAAALTALALISVSAIVYFGVVRPQFNAAVIAGSKKPQAIAVLPFKNLTRDNRDEFLGVGLADTLIMRLSRFGQFVVRPTSSVLRLGGTPAETVDNLHVEYLVEGTIQRVGDRLRISVQLVNTKDQQILWAKNFDEAGADVITIQDSIAAEVAGSLLTGISPADHAILAKRETSDGPAYEMYLKGRFFWNKRTVGDLKKSIEYFDQATTRDPEFSLAYVGLADAYQLLAEYGGMNAPEAIEKARAASRRALGINEASAEAHTSLAYTLAFYDWNWSEAEREFKRAIELNPNYSTARQWYGEYLVAFGRFDEALAETRKAREIDPTSPIIQTNIVAIYYLTRQYDRTIEETKHILDLDPKFAYGYAYQWIAHEQSGRIDKAFDSIIALDSIFYPPEIVDQEREAFAAGGWNALWQWKYERCDKPPFDRVFTDYVRAMAALRSGQTERVFVHLQNSYAKHERWFVNLSSDPQWDPIRKDPRFAEMAAKIGR